MVGATPVPEFSSSSSSNSSVWLERFCVGSLATIYYIPDFVSLAEQSSLLQAVQSAPVSKWKTLKNRRLQNWGGVVHEKGLISQPIPAWLGAVTEKITKETKLFPAPINHVLVNEYLPGQGITSHQDGPVYYPVVAILSLGAPTLMHFTPHARLVKASKVDSNYGLQEQSEEKQQIKPTCSVVLMPGSLLVFKDSAYADYLHGIDEAYEDLLDDKVVNIDSSLLYLKRRNSGKSEDAAAKDKTNRAFQLGHTEMHMQSSMEKGVGTDCILRRSGTRVSLTCRHVPKVYKNLLRL